MLPVFPLLTITVFEEEGVIKINGNIIAIEQHEILKLTE